MDRDNLARKRSDRRQAVVRVWGNRGYPVEEAVAGRKPLMEHKGYESNETAQVGAYKPVGLGREHVRSEGLTLLDAYALLRERQEGKREH